MTLKLILNPFNILIQIKLKQIKSGNIFIFEMKLKISLILEKDEDNTR